jgi:hypothetical protein
VDNSGARRWTFVFQWAGKRSEMGLGGFPGVSLADAREARNGARKALRAGVNPKEERDRKKRVANPVTFGPFAEELIAELAGGWRNATHKQQWSNTLATYCKPIWTKPVDQVSTNDVLEILKPIWTTKAETASRLRGRIERVLDAAKAKGLREGENPALWRGHGPNAGNSDC